MSRNKTPEELTEDERKRVAAYNNLFNSPEGKMVLKDMEDVFMNRSSVVPGDPYMTHAREGAREVVLYIYESMRMGEGDVT